ncbi:MAG: DNA polymerase III subunit gamma/tau, partial [bacterium]|nr:DNA polymerase III subunit gamma/tau [bacterium]
MERKSEEAINTELIKMVLYRKYRPKNFAEVVGQEHVVETLQGAIQTGRLAHAYLFTGPRGTGKTSLARLLAKAVNCDRAGGQTDACAVCDSCKEVEEGRAMDLIEIDAASNRGIDDIRALREGTRFSSMNSGKYKVYVIDECHQLSKDASNALLKTLEEPPAKTIFILATTEPHKVLPTIVSRVQKFDFKKLNTDQIIFKLDRI